MSEQAKAWYAWLDGKEGKECLADSILRRREDQQYLENRLWRAFQAGYESAEGKL